MRSAAADERTAPVGTAGRSTGGEPDVMDRRGFLAGLAAAVLAPGRVPLGEGDAAALAGRRLREPPASDLEAVVLGSVQDAGLPQPGCYTETCELGRELNREGRGRYVTSLALVEPAAGRFYLVDATPDLTRQLDLIDHPAFRERAARRDPFDGIFLTHAHVGHYLGLALLGNEGTGIRDVPVWCTRRMADFLSTNGPWSLMVEQGRIAPRVLEPAGPGPVAVAEGWHPVDELLEVKALAVPHRDEYTDTVAFVFRRRGTASGPTPSVGEAGPGAAARPDAAGAPGPSLLYLPDIDGWDAWERDVAEVVESVDVALLDATFHSADELPGRSEDDIPHPLVSRTVERLRGVVERGTRVILTHLNNSNPLVDGDGPEARAVRERGFEVAREGTRIEL